MAQAADFFGGGYMESSLTGLSERTAAQQAAARAESDRIRADAAAKQADLDRRLAESKAAKAKEAQRKQDEAWASVQARTGGLVGDLKVIGKAAARTAGTVAKVTGAVVAVVPGGQLIGAGLAAGGAALTAAAKGDVKGAITGAATAAAPALGGAAAAAAPLVNAAAQVKAAAAPLVNAAAQVKAAAAPLVNAAAQVRTLAANTPLPAGARVVASSISPNLEMVYDASGALIGTRVKAAAAVTAASAPVTTKPAAPAPAPIVAPKPATPAPVQPAPLTSITRTLKRGTNGPDVAGWQTYLINTGALMAAADGSCGDQTEAATKAWQKSRQLTPDGIVGSDSLNTALGRKGLPAAAAAKPASSAPAAAAAKPASSALAPASSAPEPQVGFVLTSAARLLEGSRWLEAPDGVAGVLIRPTGPAALRRDSAPRLWKRA